LFWSVASRSLGPLVAAPGLASTVARVVDALEAKGIEFVPGGVVLVRKPVRR
jgi:hypothetical protein